MWEQKTLGEIATYSRDRIEVSQLDLDNYVSTENMIPNKGGLTQAASLPGTKYAVKFTPKQTLVSNIRPYFRKIWQADRIGGCSNDVLCFQLNETVNNDFFYYVLSQDSFFDYMMKGAKGTKMPRGDKNHILDYEFLLPPFIDQQRIARILSNIDAKINKNQAINDNLLQQIQAIFKSWFIDFEHFNGKEPANIEYLPLEKLCLTITKGTTPTTLGMKFQDVGINFIKGESILNNHHFDRKKFSHIDSNTDQLLKRSQVINCDILFTIAGTLGRFALVDETILPANTNQAVSIIRANNNIISPYYLYSFFIGNWHNEFYNRHIQQAVQANLSLATIKSLPIAVLPRNLMNQYVSIVEPIIKYIKQLEYETLNIEQLRDSLLPKLMSGELDVSEVEI